MKIKHLNTFATLVVPRNIERRLSMEIQQMRSTETIGQYINLPRAKWAYVHRLSGSCSEFHAVGVSPSHRMIFKVIKEEGKDKIIIRKYFYDYHKEKKSC